MDAAAFQSKWGAQWAGTVNSGMLYDALAVCNNETIQRLSTLTPERIQALGREELATYVGRLALENDLIRLSVIEAEVEDILPPETYSDPEAEETELPANPHQTFTGPFAEFQQEQAIAPKPKPRRRRKRRKRRAVKPKEPNV